MIVGAEDDPWPPVPHRPPRARALRVRPHGRGFKEEAEDEEEEEEDEEDEDIIDPPRAPPTLPPDNWFNADTSAAFKNGASWPPNSRDEDIDKADVAAGVPSPLRCVHTIPTNSSDPDRWCCAMRSRKWFH